MATFTNTAAAGPVDSRASRHAVLRTLPLRSTRITAGFWAERQHINRNVRLAHDYRMLEEAGNFHNLRLAAGLAQGEYRGSYPFLDSDVYKWLEAVAYELAFAPNAALEKMADEVITLIGRAQGADGYLDSFYTVVRPEKRWQELPWGHEMYCAGHLMQAAVAHYRVTGKTSLLDIACRFADHIDSVFGPGKRIGVCGHPEIEMALVELYRATGNRRYVELSQFFIDQRGHNILGGGLKRAAYFQDRVPVREASTVEGHAVRQVYLLAGVADLYLETGEHALLDAMMRQWYDMTSRKLFITGGLGALPMGEAFGEPYELPNDRCYCETCAAIASIMWNWRLLLATGQARFADLIERTLFNGFLSGMSLDGLRNFYENTLYRRGKPEVFGPHGYERVEWYDCACCPPNIDRLLASLDHYLATSDDAGGVQIHQYASAVVETGTGAVLRLQTEYPWQGRVSVSVEQAGAASFRLSLRLPSWCSQPGARVNGQPLPVSADEQGYLTIERTWRAGDTVELDLPMPPRLTTAHPRIEPNRGSLAIERGPLVYCLEQWDQEEGIDLNDVEIEASAGLEAEWRGDLLHGVTVVTAPGYVVDTSPWDNGLYRPLAGKTELSRRPVRLTAIPYYAWANRGVGAMRVWIPHG